MKTHDSILTYTVIFEPADEGGYVAFAPSIPGCMSQGETFEEAKKNIKDAIRGCLAVLKEEGEEIPRGDKEQITALVAIPGIG